MCFLSALPCPPDGIIKRLLYGGFITRLLIHMQVMPKSKAKDLFLLTDTELAKVGQGRRTMTVLFFGRASTLAYNVRPLGKQYSSRSRATNEPYFVSMSGDHEPHGVPSAHPPPPKSLIYTDIYCFFLSSSLASSSQRCSRLLYSVPSEGAPLHRLCCILVFVFMIRRPLDRSWATCPSPTLVTAPLPPCTST